MKSTRFKAVLPLIFSVGMIAGCGEAQTAGHTDDPTPAGEATPPLMDDAAMNDYAKEQAKKAGTPAMQP